MIKMVINNFHEKDQRARVIVSKDILVVYTTALDLNIQIYDGVDTLTVSYERNTPDIKTTDYKGCLDAYKKQIKKVVLRQSFWTGTIISWKAFGAMFFG